MAGIGLSKRHIIAGAWKGIQGLIKSPFMIGSNSMSTPKVLTFHHMLAYPQTRSNEFPFRMRLFVSVWVAFNGKKHQGVLKLAF